MRRQRNYPQLTGREESPVKELNEFETSNISDTEFKIMVIRVLKELSENNKKFHGSYKELSGNYSSREKDIETMNKNQEEMKNTLKGITAF